MSQRNQFVYNTMSMFDHLFSRKFDMNCCSLVNSYGLNGLGVQAVELYCQMPKELITEVTYVCVLNACSHAGLVDVARSIFQSIQIKTGIIYCTMVCSEKLNLTN